MRLGEIALDGLRKDPETEWFALGYDLFSFDDGESFRRVKAASSSFGHMEILAFIGVWCGDCQEHFPGFARVLDSVSFPRERVRVFSLDRGKTFPGGGGLIAHHGIRKLPTFVFLRDGLEIGRIIETPRQSLLADMAAILASPYQR